MKVATRPPDREPCNRGYAACGFEESPEGCSQYNLYGDENYCALTSSVNGWKDSSTSTKWTGVGHDCDTSFGHSGSPMYYYADSYPRLVGVVSGHDADTGTNWVRQMTTVMYDKIHAWIASKSRY